MKSIYVFYLNKELNFVENVDSLAEMFFDKNSKNKNSLIDFKNKKNSYTYICEFNSKFKRKPETISVLFYPLNLDVNNINVYNFLELIVLKSIKRAQFLSKEPIDESKEKEILSKIIGRFNIYYSFKKEFLTYKLKNSKENCLNIIDLVNEIFCEILISHLLINGNKRLATMLLTNFLYQFGFYLKYTKSSFEN